MAMERIMHNVMHETVLIYPRKPNGFWKFVGLFRHVREPAVALHVTKKILLYCNQGNHLRLYRFVNFLISVAVFLRVPVQNPYHENLHRVSFFIIKDYFKYVMLY